MRVSELMHTPPVVCTPSTTIREVALLMGRHHVGSVIVVDEVGEVAGIVTDRDIVLRGAGRGRSADVAVDIVMTRHVATVDVHADLVDAATTMSKRCVRRLPVTDEFGHPHGLVALDDLVRELGSRVDLVSDLLRWQSATASP
jgi:signal-transduction protein with cAMP-binding, CBS, and nucleotidyltransferase domain